MPAHALHCHQPLTCSSACLAVSPTITSWYEASASASLAFLGATTLATWQQQATPETLATATTNSSKVQVLLLLLLQVRHIIHCLSASGKPSGHNVPSWHLSLHKILGKRAGPASCLPFCAYHVTWYMDLEHLDVLLACPAW